MNEEKINPIEEIIDKDDEKRIFIEISKIDGIHEYLRALLAKDIRQHFTCEKEQQDLVRGAYFRTEYFAKRIKLASSLDKNN